MAVSQGGLKQRLLLAVFLASIAALSAWAVWTALTGDDPAGQTPVAPIEPAQETSTATTPTAPSAAAPESVTASVAPVPLPATAVASDVIAFRKDGVLYVAAGDGSGARSVARSPAGPYALSPDGRTLAHITAGRLWLVPVDGGGALDVGSAAGDEAGIGECPVWAPDSGSVYFTRPDADGSSAVWRVLATGGQAKRVMAGGCPSVSPDGRLIGSVVADGEEPAVVIWQRGGASRRLLLAGDTPIALAMGVDAAFVAVFDATGSSAIVRVPVDGRSRTRLTGAPTDAPRASWGALKLSPDGTRLAAVAVGDDRYSRLSIVAAATGEALPLSARRDCYARYWDADGTHLYFVEGNAYQGEATRLMRVEPSGAGRAVVAEGAE